MYSHVDHVRPRKDRLKSLKGYQVLSNRIIVAWRSFWKSLELPPSLWTYFHVGSIKHCNEICDGTFFQNVLPLLGQVFSMNNRATRFPHWRNPKLWFTTSVYTVYFTNKKTHTINAKHGCKSPYSLLSLKYILNIILTREKPLKQICKNTLHYPKCVTPMFRLLHIQRNHTFVISAISLCPGTS